MLYAESSFLCITAVLFTVFDDISFTKYKIFFLVKFSAPTFNILKCDVFEPKQSPLLVEGAFLTRFALLQLKLLKNSIVLTS